MGTRDSRGRTRRGRQAGRQGPEVYVEPRPRTLRLCLVEQDPRADPWRDP